MKKNTWLFLAVFVITLLVVIKIIVASVTPQPQQRLAKAKGKINPKTAVTVCVAKPQALQENILASGTVIADQDVELRSETSGKITGIYFKEGKAVKKGTLLLKISDIELQAQLAKAQASLALVQGQEKRQNALLQKDVVNQEEYDITSRNLLAAQADVQLISAQIAKTEIYAPFDGVIGLRSVDQGDYITAGAKIANIVSLRPLTIEFAIPQRFAGKIEAGAELTFTIESSAREYAAVVCAVEPKIDESTRTFSLRATCVDPDKSVIPGAFCRVIMVARKNEQALTVPSQALVADANGYNVYIVNRSIAQMRPVLIGIRDEQNVEIIKGVSEGDSVIVSGILSIRPGAPVDAQKAD